MKKNVVNDGASPAICNVFESKVAVTRGNMQPALEYWRHGLPRHPSRRQVDEHAVHAYGREPDNLTSNEEKPGCRDPAPPAGIGNNCSSAAALSPGPRRCQSVSLTLSTFQRLSISLHDGVYIQSDLIVAKIALDAAITEKGRSGRVIFSSAAREAGGYGIQTVSDGGSTSTPCGCDLMDLGEAQS